MHLVHKIFRIPQFSGGFDFTDNRSTTCDANSTHAMHSLKILTEKPALKKNSKVYRSTSQVPLNTV